MSTLPNSTEITEAIAGRGLTPSDVERRRQDIADFSQAVDAPTPSPPTEESLRLAEQVREGIHHRGRTPTRCVQLAEETAILAGRSRIEQLVASVELTPEDITDQVEAIRTALHPDS